MGTIAGRPSDAGSLMAAWWETTFGQDEQPWWETTFKAEPDPMSRVAPDRVGAAGTPGDLPRAAEY